MNELLQEFLEEEITAAVYNDLWRFVTSDSIVRGTFECRSHIVLKLSADQFLIYRHSFGVRNTKYQDAVICGKLYFLKKINSMAYERRLPDIQNIFD